MRLFVDEYPCDQSPRLEALEEELDPKTFRPFDNRFFALIDIENFRFERAVDEYARNIAAREKTIYEVMPSAATRDDIVEGSRSG